MGALGKKLKGKLQQVQGTLQQSQGMGLKGGLQRMKGKVNESVADMQLRSRRRRRI